MMSSIDAAWRWAIGEWRRWRIAKTQGVADAKAASDATGLLHAQQGGGKCEAFWTCRPCQYKGLRCHVVVACKVL